MRWAKQLPADTTLVWRSILNLVLLCGSMRPFSTSVTAFFQFWWSWMPSYGKACVISLDNRPAVTFAERNGGDSLDVAAQLIEGAFQQKLGRRSRRTAWG